MAVYGYEIYLRCIGQYLALISAISRFTGLTIMEGNLIMKAKVARRSESKNNYKSALNSAVVVV